VESLTAEPESAQNRLVEVLPVAFRCEWAARLTGGPDEFVIDYASDGAPPTIELKPGSGVDRQSAGDDLLAIVPLGHAKVVVLGRRGGPEFLDSELARLEHLVALAASIARRG
jgi:hypothetical protein